LGIRNRKQLFLHPQRGNLFESFIISELLKHRLNNGLPPDLYTWRDNSGNEIDAVIEDGTRLSAIEIKSGQTILPDFFNGLKKWTAFSGAQNENCFLIYPGVMNISQQGIRIVSWDRTAELSGKAI
jgi:predicted AAA+ superfamily ATPase